MSSRARGWKSAPQARRKVCTWNGKKERERENKTKTFGGWIKFLVDKDASIPPLRFPLSLHRLWGVLNITRYAVGYLLRDLPTFLSLSLPLSRFHPPFYFAFASFRCVVVVSRGTVLLNFFRDLSSQPCNLRSSLSRVKKLPLSPPLCCDYSWKIKNTTCRLYVRRVIRCMYVWCHWWMVDQSKSFIMGHSLKKDFCYFLFIYFFFVIKEQRLLSLIAKSSSWLRKDIFITVNLLFILQLSFWNSFCLLDRLYVYLIYTCVRMYKLKIWKILLHFVIVNYALLC